MARSIEQKAERFVKVANRTMPRFVLGMAALVKADRFTEIHNRDFDLSFEEKNTLPKQLERAWAYGRFGATVLLHGPGMAIAAGRLSIAAKPFEKALQETRPQLVEAIESDQTDYYEVAAEMLGLDPEAELNAAMERAGVSEQFSTD